jgi:hypothetical protein
MPERYWNPKTFGEKIGFRRERASTPLTVQALGTALIMLFPQAERKSVVSQDETDGPEGVERLAAIQHRLEILMRDAREIRAASTKLSDSDPFAILRQTLEERARRRRPPSE